MHCGDGYIGNTDVVLSNEDEEIHEAYMRILKVFGIQPVKRNMDTAWRN